MTSPLDRNTPRNARGSAKTAFDSGGLPFLTDKAYQKTNERKGQIGVFAVIDQVLAVIGNSATSPCAVHYPLFVVK